jgi:hypothetical protein
LEKHPQEIVKQLAESKKKVKEVLPEPIPLRRGVLPEPIPKRFQKTAVEEEKK